MIKSGKEQQVCSKKGWILFLILLCVAFLVSCKGKEDTGCFAGKADNKMLEHIVLAEMKAYLRQNISQEQMQQSMRKQHTDSIEAYELESTDCEKRQEQIKLQNRQNYEKYHEGQMNQKQFMEAKKQLEEERERLQKRVQELEELINGEKEILMKKNIPGGANVEVFRL